jgi:hypothetical protein
MDHWKDAVEGGNRHGGDYENVLRDFRPVKAVQFCSRQMSYVYPMGTLWSRLDRSTIVPCPPVMRYSQQDEIGCEFELRVPRAECDYT